MLGLLGRIQIAVGTHGLSGCQVRFIHVAARAILSGHFMLLHALISDSDIPANQNSRLESLGASVLKSSIPGDMHDYQGSTCLLR